MLDLNHYINRIDELRQELEQLGLDEEADQLDAVCTSLENRMEHA